MLHKPAGESGATSFNKARLLQKSSVRQPQRRERPYTSSIPKDFSLRSKCTCRHFHTFARVSRDREMLSSGIVPLSAR